jgi:hypothetical protein
MLFIPLHCDDQAIMFKAFRKKITMENLDISAWHMNI